MKHIFRIFCILFSISALISIGRIQRLNDNVNSQYVDYSPSVDKDDLYFTSNRRGGIGKKGDFDIWVAPIHREQNAISFGKVYNLGRPINSKYYDGFPVIRNYQGNAELYFTSFRFKGRRGLDYTNIYFSVKAGGKWQPAKPVKEVNSNWHDRAACFSKNGMTMYFSSNRPSGHGADDIWQSQFNEETNRWSKPENMRAPLNSRFSESGFCFSDDSTGYMSSIRPGGFGGYDSYKVTKKNNQYTVQLLARPINSVADDEFIRLLSDKTYLFVSNRKSSRGSFDIFTIPASMIAELPPIQIDREDDGTLKSGQIHRAATALDIVALKKLLSVKNIDTQDGAGNTALHRLAAKVAIKGEGREYWQQVKILRKMAKLLIKAGADINIKNRLGQTALDIAKDSDNKVILEVIKATGQ